jgi:hypothetical protein
MPTRRTRILIDDCFALTLDGCVRDHKMGERPLIIERTEEKHPIVEMVIGTFSHDDFAQATHLDLDLRRRDDEAPVRQTVELVQTIPHFGGFRKWFRCPACGSRAPRLFLPPTASEFRCKRCHRLRYRSQERRRTKGNLEQTKRPNMKSIMPDCIH